MLKLEFTRFEVYACNADTATCPCDYVKIVEGDWTTLIDRGCGHSTTTPSSSYYFLPPIFTTKTNVVDIFFHTDSSGAWSGWSLNWTAVTPGLKPLLALLTQKLPKSMIFQPGKLGKQTSPSTHLKGRCALRFFAVQIYTLFRTDIFGLILTLSGHILKKGQLPRVTLVTLDALILLKQRVALAVVSLE